MVPPCECFVFVVIAHWLLVVMVVVVVVPVCFYAKPVKCLIEKLALLKGPLICFSSFCSNFG